MLAALGPRYLRNHVEDQMAQGRTDTNFSQGWGIAAFITALAVGSFVTAGIIKNNIYHAPRDPSSPNEARVEGHATPAAEHAPTAH
jgi:hypothetical protein